MSDPTDPLARVRQAFKKGELTLYLGAGVSYGNRLPKWDQLVQSMYFNALSKHLYNWQLAPQYLFAVAKWHLDRTDEALEITARKVYLHYEGKKDEFFSNLRETLYASNPSLDGDAIRSANPTLDAVVRLCEVGLDAPVRGIRSVVTYNFDSLLEMAMGDRPIESLFNAASRDPSKLPIYHVHGFIPADGAGSSMDQIVFTEDQYNLASQNAYSWSNLVQINCMSTTVGLMVGLSLSDRNMRRLLDAIKRTSLQHEQYLIMKRPKLDPKFDYPDECDLQKISQGASEYLERSGRRDMASSNGEMWKGQVNKIVDAVKQQSSIENTRVLKDLGITVIWCDDYRDDLAKKIASIYSGA